VPSTPTSIPTETSEPVGTDITQELPPGDAAHGSLLVETFDLDCASCHVRGHVGAPAPYWAKDPENDQQGVATRAQTRYLAADYTGQATSAREYLFESIVSPNIYIVPGRIDYYFDVAAGRSQMPGNFGKKLDKQMLADVIAYLETIK
jgi:mono/diheme cytochrome c family protein